MNSFLKTMGHELGQLTNGMSTTSWIVVACVTVIAGYFFLRGDSLRST